MLSERGKKTLVSLCSYFERHLAAKADLHSPSNPKGCIPLDVAEHQNLEGEMAMKKQIEAILPETLSLNAFCYDFALGREAFRLSFAGMCNSTFLAGAQCAGTLCQFLIFLIRSQSIQQICVVTFFQFFAFGLLCPSITTMRSSAHPACLSSSVSNGVGSLINLITCLLCEPGDVVLLPTPSTYVT